MKRLALVVGIDTYPENPLSCARADAVAIAERLSSAPYTFEVDILLDETATRTNVRQAIQKLLAHKDCLCLFFFAGHGTVATDGVYLVTVDGKTGDDGIDLEFLRRNVALPAKAPRILLLDCCFSGAASVISLETADSSRIAVENSLRGFTDSRVVIAACRAHETADEFDDSGHDAFTAALLQGLEGSAADSQGDITVSSLYDHIARPFEESSGQKPVFKGDISGRIVIGSGFPRVIRRALSKLDAEAVATKAHTLIESFEERQSLGHKERLSYGFRNDCAALTPIAEWFERKLNEQPDLGRREDFRSALSALRAWRVRLGTLEIGTVLKDGKINKELGDGSFGTVWKVDNPASGESLAYKVYNPASISDSDKVRRFRRGYDAMAQLEHPNIVKVTSYTSVPLGFFMQFIDGPNLRHFAGALESEPTVNLLIGICDTLRHAHGRNVIHRDIKPENIIVRWDAHSGRWEPFLTDFDLAWFSTATRMTQEALGSYYYAAPEQLSKPGSHAAHAASVDIYAFGQLCYFMLTQGDPTLTSDKNIENLRRRLEGWSSVRAAQGILDLYEQCTKWAPEDRYLDFNKVWAKLAQVRGFLGNSGPEALIPLNRFLAEVRYRVLGLYSNSTADTDSNSFDSRSGRTLITATLKEQMGRTYELELLVRPRELMFGNNQDGRMILNQRLDDAISAFENVSRASGGQGVFEAWIRIKGLVLRGTGVQRCAEVIARVIDACERA